MNPLPPTCASHRAPLRLAATLTLGLAALTACSTNSDNETKQLPPGDTAACNAAHANNARTVYNVRNQPTDTTLKKQANRIYPGSDENDAEAISGIKNRCGKIGYRPQDHATN